jgi:hypothetical protein
MTRILNNQGNEELAMEYTFFYPKHRKAFNAIIVSPRKSPPGAFYSYYRYI